MVISNCVQVKKLYCCIEMCNNEIKTLTIVKSCEIYFNVTHSGQHNKNVALIRSTSGLICPHLEIQ